MDVGSEGYPWLYSKKGMWLYHIPYELSFSNFNPLSSTVIMSQSVSHPPALARHCEGVKINLRHASCPQGVDHSSKETGFINEK